MKLHQLIIICPREIGDTCWLCAIEEEHFDGTNQVDFFPVTLYYPYFRGVCVCGGGGGGGGGG